eukprot:GAHX01001022.1.p1 GENE.GAHX01001022.1~~GAHX01001022.1.p1  ORF type:complete len:692 (-),score=152.64 GAHX01001022.1:149-2224(-)
MGGKYLNQQCYAEVPSVIIEYEKQSKTQPKYSTYTDLTKKLPTYSNQIKKVRSKYKKIKYLGKGGYAKCFEVNKEDTGAHYACKCVSKAQVLYKPRNKAKIVSEIRIHRALSNIGIVQFHHCFEDSDFVYILLELCENNTLKELMQARKQLTKFEVQFFLFHVLSSLNYLHTKNIIHRDIKLANILLGNDLIPKLGDFGLAAQLATENDKKTTMCGTPNYIAPEIISSDSDGHGKAVDIWSLGVLAFAILLGFPPFETSKVKETYKKIKINDYNIPKQFSDQYPNAADLIKKMLCSDPIARPSAEHCLKHGFFDSFYSCFNHNEALINNFRLPNCVLKREPMKTEIKTLNNTHVDLSSFKGGAGTYRSRKEAYKKEEKKEDKAKNFEMQVAIGFNKEIIKQLHNNKSIEFSFEDFIKRTISVDRYIDYTIRYGWGFSLNINVEVETLSSKFKDLFKTLNLTGLESVQQLTKFAKGFTETVGCFFNDDSYIMISDDMVMYGPSVHDEINTPFNKHLDDEDDYFMQPKSSILNILGNMLKPEIEKVLEAKTITKKSGEKVDLFFFLLKNYPLKLKKKTMLIKHFKQLLQSEESCTRNFDVWVEEVVGTDHGPIFILNNGNMVAKFKDGSQILLSMFKNINNIKEKDLAWVIFIDKEDRRFEVLTNLNDDLIKLHADKPSLYRRIRYCLQYYNR